MSYEQNCTDYAIFGNPERDHWDYEFNAQFDRFDGWGDPDPNDDPGCPDCGYNEDCVGCKAAREWLANESAKADSTVYDDVPF